MSVCESDSEEWQWSATVSEERKGENKAMVIILPVSQTCPHAKFDFSSNFLFQDQRSKLSRDYPISDFMCARAIVAIFVQLDV